MLNICNKPKIVAIKLPPGFFFNTFQLQISSKYEVFKSFKSVLFQQCHHFLLPIWSDYFDLISMCFKEVHTQCCALLVTTSTTLFSTANNSAVIISGERKQKVQLTFLITYCNSFKTLIVKMLSNCTSEGQKPTLNLIFISVSHTKFLSFKWIIILSPDTYWSYDFIKNWVSIISLVSFPALFSSNLLLLEFFHTF